MDENLCLQSNADLVHGGRVNNSFYSIPLVTFKWAKPVEHARPQSLLAPKLVKRRKIFQPGAQ